MASRERADTEAKRVASWRKRRLCWPRLTIDLSRRDHRRNLLLAFIVFSLVGTGLLFAGYKSFIYAESSEFCGTLCHPMTSEFVRYEMSPHAQDILCSRCHPGGVVANP